MNTTKGIKNCVISALKAPGPITDSVLDELIASIKVGPVKNRWMGSRTLLTPDGAITQLRHDNKIFGYCHPNFFMRLVKYNG